MKREEEGEGEKRNQALNFSETQEIGKTWKQIQDIICST